MSNKITALLILFIIGYLLHYMNVLTFILICIISIIFTYSGILLTILLLNIIAFCFCVLINKYKINQFRKFLNDI